MKKIKKLKFSDIEYFGDILVVVSYCVFALIFGTYGLIAFIAYYIGF